MNQHTIVVDTNKPVNTLRFNGTISVVNSLIKIILVIAALLITFSILQTEFISGTGQNSSQMLGRALITEPEEYGPEKPSIRIGKTIIPEYRFR